MKERRPAAAPAVAAASVGAMLFASRLPPTLDFFAPRTPFFFVYEGAVGAFDHPWFRSFYVWSVSLALSGAVLSCLIDYVRSVKSVRWSVKSFLARGLQAAVAVLLAKWSLSVWFEVSQTVFFPFGSLSVAEPFLNFVVLFSVFFFFVSIIRSFRWLPLGPWAGVNVMLSLLSFGFWNAFAGPLPEASGARRTYVVLTEERGAPSKVVYDLPVDATPDRVLGLERLARNPGVSRLAALRGLYEARAKDMDAAGLREALRLGCAAGDDLARALLLEHALSAPPSAEAGAALDALADERMVRVGPLAAARLARAYARQGRVTEADRWAVRAEEGPRGIPRGLLALSSGGGAGRLSGRVAGLPVARVGLYRKSDPAAPYALDAAALSASVVPDDKGRFSFSGLGAGRYYLAFALARTPEAEVAVSGSKGDLVLDEKRKSVDVSVTLR